MFNISTLTLQAGKSITINNNVVINLAGGNFSATINDENAVAAQRDSGVAQFVMNSESQILTDGGNISIKPGSFGGEVIGTVQLNGGTLNSGTGTIDITGRGSLDGATKTGIFLSNGAVVESTGTGAITLEGTGGAGTNATRGIEIQNSRTTFTNYERTTSTTHRCISPPGEWLFATRATTLSVVNCTDCIGTGSG
ncbi:MAG: hypothetical protein RIM23_13560 [Coleofasciculus sp. G3-WIS-01]|uniref:hypothetical protein n=1 Tax=Coleofasciculus sp. G3-WIS-01 TaxID=3069528 RepID=UPI0032FD3054